MRRLTLLSLTICVLACWTASAFATDGQEGLRGPAFTDPAQTMPMRRGWQEMPPQYESWAKGGDLALSLDQHLYPALRPLINRFAAEHKVDIRVQEGTCGISAGQLVRKRADITGYCCPAGKTDRFPGLIFHTLGISALRIIVNKDNPVDNLTLDQVRDVFRGRISSWGQIKGMEQRFPPSAFIQPVARLHCKTRPGHWRLLLDNEDLFSPKLREVGTIDDMLSFVSSDRHSIGYEVQWHINNYAHTDRIKSLRIDNADPNRPEDVLSLAYPFYRTFVVTTWQGKNPRNDLARQLVAFIEAHMDEVEPRFDLIPARLLHKAGWQFTDDELTGEPQ